MCCMQNKMSLSLLDFVFVMDILNVDVWHDDKKENCFMTKILLRKKYKNTNAHAPTHPQPHPQETA